MSSNPPRLLAEDRAEFARLLDEALREPTVRQALAEPGHHLTAEQLHTKALADADTVAAPAGPEYEHYLALRTALAEHPGSTPQAGAGLFPVLTVLTPVLAGAAGLILLLLGWLLRAAAPDLALGRSTVTAGVAALAVAAAALLIGGAGLVLTALRDASTAPGHADPQQHADLTEARTAWQTALRERALLPWLHANLGAAPALAPLPHARPAPPDLHSPGYSRAAYSSPGFTSPGAEGLTDHQGRPRTAEFTGPGYSSPDFTSPGPEGLTDDRGRRRAEGPGFTSPGPEQLTDAHGRPRPARLGYTAPDFTSPAEGRTPRRPGFTGPDHDSPGYTAPDFTGPGPEGLTDEDGNPRPDGPGFTRPGHHSPDFTGPNET